LPLILTDSFGVEAVLRDRHAGDADTTCRPGQAGSQEWNLPRTLDGRPDFQGRGSTTTRHRSSGQRFSPGGATSADQKLAALKRKARELFSGDATRP